ncbi:helix-turn-helix domain-containing protein [Nocardiopsis terrae]
MPAHHRRYRVQGTLGDWPTEAELVEEDVRMVLATGAPYTVVAARCGISTRRVNRIVARWRLGVVAGAGPVSGEVLGPVRAA